VHDPALGSPHVPLPPPQSVVAPSTQVESHVTWQQYGSAAQTAAQHVASLQAGVPCGVKQLPALPDPQSWQSRFAASTHTESHAAVQQVGSMLHTVAQQVASEHPGVGCALKHDPMAPGGHWANAGRTETSRTAAQAQARIAAKGRGIGTVSRIGTPSPSQE
jgi:hypothetical protein